MALWRNAVGTGPFILTDYLSGSAATLVKNPDYWATDPVGPGQGNQLPYIDGIQYLIIPDVSTRQAALRTGKKAGDTATYEAPNGSSITVEIVEAIPF